MPTPDAPRLAAPPVVPTREYPHSGVARAISATIRSTRFEDKELVGAEKREVATLGPLRSLVGGWSPTSVAAADDFDRKRTAGYGL